jgi:glycosyltransferase involved in cell wall biosynthesis
VTKLALLDPLLLSKLFLVLRRYKIDFLYAHHYEALVAALAARVTMRYPVIYDAHTLLETELPDYVSGSAKPVLRTIGKWIDGFLPRRADHIVAVTAEIAQRLTTHLNDSSPITVVSNGLELGHFMGSKWVPEIRDDAKKILIFTGNLAAYQGIELMLEAFALLRWRRNDILLRIITNDDFRPYVPLAQKLEVESDIEVLDSDFSMLPREIAKASVALNPRLSMDGIPQKLLNYMAVGVPIVSFAGSARNLVDRANGLVIPDGDTEMFADAIDSLLNDQKTATMLGAAAKVDAERAGTWLDVARKLESVFEGLSA